MDYYSHLIYGSPVLFISVVIFIVSFFVVIFSLWNIFVKAGRSGIWVFVPIYNIVVLLEISNTPLWHLILLFIPVLNLVALFALMYKLSRAFGYDLEFGIGLFFLPFVFMPILAFGGAEYVGNLDE
jgi:hypothetical protein